MADVLLPRQLSWLFGLLSFVSACRAPEPSPNSPATPEPTRSVAPSEAASAAGPTATAPEPDAASRPITNRELVSQPQPGRYQLEAYFIELRPCPVCEAPLMCKPCLSEHVVVADEPSPPAGTATAMLRVTAEQLRDLVVGARYRLEIQVHPAVGGGSGVNYVEVLEYAGPLD